MLFFTPDISGDFATLDEEESRHLLTVLRRKVGDGIQLTDGRGFFYQAEIAEIGKRQVLARVVGRQAEPPTGRGRLHVGIAPTKQLERIEWFLEKATEIGVDELTLLHCQRSERDSARVDRLEKILRSAMKQSLRATLPRLQPMTRFQPWAAGLGAIPKYIAWCADTPLPHLNSLLQAGQDAAVAIGPEGDFSPEEVQYALGQGFQGVSLGTARLRTETAGLLAVAAFALRG
jgi:16S rRNA (uracil1498-N3)-methyltransferase